MKISDLLTNAAAFKLNPNDYMEDDQCCICLENYHQDDNVIRLPCNSKHYFHAHCIGDWVQRNNHCPLCKAPITAEDIKKAEKDANRSDRNNDPNLGANSAGNRSHRRLNDEP